MVQVCGCIQRPPLPNTKKSLLGPESWTGQSIHSNENEPTKWWDTNICALNWISILFHHYEDQQVRTFSADFTLDSVPIQCAGHIHHHHHHHKPTEDYVIQYGLKFAYRFITIFDCNMSISSISVACYYGLFDWSREHGGRLRFMFYHIQSWQHQQRQMFSVDVYVWYTPKYTDWANKCRSLCCSSECVCRVCKSTPFGNHSDNKHATWYWEDDRVKPSVATTASSTQIVLSYKANKNTIFP